MPPIRTVWAEIDLSALKNNLKRIRGFLGNRRTELLAVVKAEAYGHGMKVVARTLFQNGVRFFGVANIDEAVALRDACPRARLLVLGSFHSSQVPLYIRHRVCPTVSSVEDVRILSAALRSRKGTLPVHVKIDTGMGRLGVWHEHCLQVFGALREHPRLAVEGIYTHFSSADGPDKNITNRQIALFNRAVRKIKALGFRPRTLHAANSVGLLRFGGAHLNLVRPGILLYGIQPGKEKLKGLRPVLSLKTRISFLKSVKKGSSISYGALYVTPKATTIATLPVGYSHGYRVGFSNKTHVLIRGCKYPVVGRVTMDQTLVDVGLRPRVKRWDPVTLIGTQGGECITVEELAAIAGSIPYEIVCAIHSRIPRIYKR